MNTSVKLLVVTLAFGVLHPNAYGMPPTLQQYIAGHSGLRVSGTVIACAGGGKAVSMGDTNFPIAIYFYPIPDAAHFHYFESDSVDINPRDYSQYREKSLPIVPLFNGCLRRFKRGPLSHEVWGIVSDEAGGRLLLSNPIRLKYPVQQTQMGNELVHIQTNRTEPIFRWTDGAVKNNAIYFEVVSDSAGNLISGTYTDEKHWQFYHLDNVMFKIHDVHPPPTLEPETAYTFTLMGVSKDNWVNMMARKPFTTGK